MEAVSFGAGRAVTVSWEQRLEENVQSSSAGTNTCTLALPCACAQLLVQLPWRHFLDVADPPNLKPISDTCLFHMNFLTQVNTLEGDLGSWCRTANGKSDLSGYFPEPWI